VIRSAVFALLVFVILSAAKDLPLRHLEDPSPSSRLRMTPWVWEHREDLRFIGEHRTVAFYAGIITLDGDRVEVAPRRNPLLLPKNTHRIAVIRIETHRATLEARQRRATLEAIRRLYRNAEELQIDFDATRSERAFYRALLFDVRDAIDAPLTITALASWCSGDRWMQGLPIDGAVSMLFRVGHARIAPGDDLAEPLCRANVGVSLDEPHLWSGGLLARRRVWTFNPNAWTEESWKNAELFASR
jgi:hypothetical protein